jgi:hypothetical protein
VAAACGPRRVALPADPGAPLADFAAVHAQVTDACRGVRTLTAELGLSGRAGEQRLRGRVVAGFERPASMRLEGVAPFGPPAFILAARGGTAVLLLPRDERILRDATADDILGALTGVSIAPADLQAILTGCVAANAAPVGGRVHGNGWASLDLDGGARMYLRPQNGAWQLAAARRTGWLIEYPAWQGRFPQSVRLQSDGAAVPVDLTATLAQIEANVDIPPAAFTVTAPAGARDLTIDELRDAGPLRGES